MIYFSIHPTDISESPLQIAVSSHDPEASARNVHDHTGLLQGVAPLPSGAAVVLDSRLLHTEGPNWGRRPHYTIAAEFLSISFLRGQAEKLGGSDKLGFLKYLPERHMYH